MCFKRLEDTADEMVGKAAYFRFLTLLGVALCSLPNLSSRSPSNGLNCPSIIIR